MLDISVILQIFMSFVLDTVELNYSPLLRQKFPKYSTQCPMNYKFHHCSDGNRHSLSTRQHFLQYFHVALSLSLTHNSWSVLCWVLERTCYIHLCSSLSVQLSPLWYSVQYTLAILVFQDTTLSQLTESARFCLSSPPQCYSLKILSRL